jgi:hypothetical protein
MTLFIHGMFPNAGLRPQKAQFSESPGKDTYDYGRLFISCFNRNIARWSSRMSPLLGVSISAISVITIAMVNGASSTVNQKRRVSVKPREKVAIVDTKKIKSQTETGMRFSAAEMRF